MIQDGTSGWHGHKNGLALFYVDQQHFQQEFHETSLTSNMNSYFQLMIKPWTFLKSPQYEQILYAMQCTVNPKPIKKHTKLLGSPYSECADNNESSHCSRNLAEETIRTKCGCRYGLIHNDSGTEVHGYKTRYLRQLFFSGSTMQFHRSGNMCK